jgi:lysophospholipase L1-like esterase
VHRKLLPLFASLLAIGVAVPAGGGILTAGQPVGWVGTWSASPIGLRPGEPLPAVFRAVVPFSAGTGGRTVRDVIRATLAGASLRIRLTNAFGSRRVTFEDVRVAVSAGGAATVRGTSRRVRFGGRNTVSIPVGGVVASDSVSMRVHFGEELAISIYSAGPTGAPTAGMLPRTNYVSVRGDAAGTRGGGAYPSSATTWYWLSGVDVLPVRRGAGGVVVLGDSITEGGTSTVDAAHDWPSLLADRLHAHDVRLSVLNAGISGNNLHEGTPCFGQSGTQRLARDVLDQSGVRYVILALGTNDIMQPHTPRSSPVAAVCDAHDRITAAGMIALYKDVIGRVHARGLTVYGATITPYGGYAVWTPALEAERRTINRWILTGHAFDGVIDFARAIEDRRDPARLDPRLDSGDGLHPNDAGYAAMARSVPLSLFAARVTPPAAAATARAGTRIVSAPPGIQGAARRRGARGPMAPA